MRSSYESMSRSPGWRRVPEWCGMDPGCPGTGNKGSGGGSCGGAWSVERP